MSIALTLMIYFMATVGILLRIWIPKIRFFSLVPFLFKNK